MAIKKLVANQDQSAKFVLKKNEGILAFKCNDENICLYLQQPSPTDFKKLEKFKLAKEIRFVGDESIYQNLRENEPSWPDFLKKIFIEETLEVYYHSESGKIRIPRKSSLNKRDVLHKKKVLIVDDSKTIQKLLKKIINNSSKLEVFGVANNPQEAQELIDKDTPDLITLDIHMPGMNGVEFLKSYLANKNIPTVMISSVSMNEGPLVMEALSSGAITYIKKPSLEQVDEVASDILDNLEYIAENKSQKKSLTTFAKTKFQFHSLQGLIAIGSSTGGTQALQAIFTSLPDQIPPIVVVQHIPAVFSKALADRLNTLCPFLVKEAEDGELIKSNTIYIAPGDKQMKLAKRGSEKKIIITDDPPLNRFRPSVDYLFQSLPAVKEENLLGLILTGMGKDGAQGLLGLKQSGARTIAQDEATSVVFGMPKEAIQIGAADKVVPLDEMSNNMVLEFNKIIKKIAA